MEKREYSMKHIVLIIFTLLSLIAKENTQGLENKNNSFDVKAAQSVTYTIINLQKNNRKYHGTAVAVSPNGRLVTAYHNISSYKELSVLSHDNKRYSVRVGKVSVESDLAYIYIEAKNIPFAKATQQIALGESIYILKSDDLLLKGIVAKNREKDFLVNLDTQKGMSGAGVFNPINELVGILSREDILHDISLCKKTTAFNDINETYQAIEPVDYNVNNKNYDTSYCDNEYDLQQWERLRKLSDLRIQKLHALFLGLCQKVKNRDLTTDEAQYIFEEERQKLLKQ
jgi:hypothetical protein